MTINDVELFLVEREAIGSEPPIPTVLVRLATKSGLEGWGEAALPWRASELSARRDILLSILAGRSAFDIEELLDLEALRPRPLQAAVEMASWDLVGQVAGLPLCCLFGGQYRQRLPLGIRLHGATIEQVLQLSREMAEQGFHWQTVSATGRLSSDEDVVTALVEAVGDRVELRLDGRGVYNPEQALELCRRIEDVPLDFLLDPLADSRLEPLAVLRRQTTVPLAVSRAIEGPADMMALIRGGAARLAVIDVQRVGGLANARRCGTIAQAAGIGASLSAGPSFGIATAAMLQLAAATPAFTGCIECPNHRPVDDLAIEDFETIDGMIAVPQGPGIGIEVDRVKVEQYHVG